MPELIRRDGEPLVQKEYGDSFEATDLESVLAERGVGALVVSGAQTDACIRSTLHGAIIRGYDATLVPDAHTTEDLTRVRRSAARQVIAHTNLYWQFHGRPAASRAPSAPPTSTSRSSPAPEPGPALSRPGARRSTPGSSR